MGVMWCLAPCCVCGRLFTFNPYRVPSVRVEGEREPVCESCITIANDRRRANRLEPLVPLSGAYEPVDEDAFEDDDR